MLTCRNHAQVTGALERKDSLMAQVRQMSDEAGSGKHLDASGGHSESFQQAYAQAVLELRKVRPILCAVLPQYPASGAKELDRWIFMAAKDTASLGFQRAFVQWAKVWLWVYTDRGARNTRCKRGFFRLQAKT